MSLFQSMNYLEEKRKVDKKGLLLKNTISINEVVFLNDTKG